MDGIAREKEEVDKKKMERIRDDITANVNPEFIIGVRCGILCQM